MKLVYVLAAVFVVVTLLQFPGVSRADEADGDDTDLELEVPPAVPTGGAASGTDAGTVDREAGAIKVDGLSAAEYQEMKSKSEKHAFQAEVSRMMKLIINSLYTNKEIFLRELISNASDALDKIRFLSLTDKSMLGDKPDLSIKIHVDKENHVLHITDTGIGMTKADLVSNLGTIAKSGTAEFLAKASDGSVDTSNLIGQFGVGFYSAFLVADTVVVTTKHNDDKQYIWESDAASFSIMEDTREDEQLGRGTRVSLYLKEEAYEFLEQNNIKDLIVRYSEFINFDIYLYTSKTVQVEAEEEEEEAEAEENETEDTEASEDDVAVEDEDAEAEEAAPAKKMVDKTVWDWEVINANKPIWTRNSKDVEQAEYHKFYRVFSKETSDPIGHIHFTAEGEVTFRSILFIPSEAPANFFNEYGKHKSSIKMFVRRVFITDQFEDMLPKYLSFIRGVVDSDDLPLNVSRESLQQHKLLKVIKKKLVRKALEMIKKLDADDYKKFWKEFGTSIKLGLIEDYANRTRLAKLLRFSSSHAAEELTSLEDYVSRMKKGQDNIFFVAGASRAEVEKSPFAERLLKHGYEVLYLVEPVDEYTIQNLPEFDGKKFQNAAKEGLKLGDAEKEAALQAELENEFAPLTKWMSENLKEDIEKAVISNRLTETPCALIASSYGWSGNMERIMKAQAYAKTDDTSSSFYASQKKTLEINPRHPLIKKLNAMVKAEESTEEEKTNLLELSRVMIDTARIRSGYNLGDSTIFAGRIERMLRLSLNIDPAEAVEAEPDMAPAAEDEAEDAEEDAEDDAEEKADTTDDTDDAEPKDEL